jgi:hypothetical protein
MCYLLLRTILLKFIKCLGIVTFCPFNSKRCNLRITNFSAMCILVYLISLTRFIFNIVEKQFLHMRHEAVNVLVILKTEINLSETISEDLTASQFGGSPPQFFLLFKNVQDLPADHHCNITPIYFEVGNSSIGLHVYLPFNFNGLL